MADNMDDNIKKAKAYKDSLDAINKTIESQNKLIGALAGEMGIAYTSFQTQTKKTQEDRLKEIKLINDATKSVKSQKDALASTINSTLNLNEAFVSAKKSSEVFSSIISSIDLSNLSTQFSGIEDVQNRINELQKRKGELNKEELDEFSKLKKINDSFIQETNKFNKKNKKDFEIWLESNKEIDDLLNSMPFDSISDKMEFIGKLREGDLSAMEQALAVSGDDLASKGEMLKMLEQIKSSQGQLNELQAEASNEMKTQTNLAKNLWSLIENNSQDAFQGIWSSMKETNQAFKDAQKDFGLMFGGDGASYKDMANLSREAAKFGVSTEEALQMMGNLGEELRTTDTKYLAGATEHFLAIQKATGISAEEVGTIAGEMMRSGKSAEDFKDFTQDALNISKQYGVNSKKVLGSIAKNMEKMRHMGFTGGEESLAKMTAQAERLRMNVDEIFDVAQKARSIEGAMDMASELQLAGGSFANINPMDLLSAARKGPAELQKILTQMGGDIGSWNKETGEFQFDPVDVDRLQIVADATGQSLDSIQKMIQKNAEDNKKTDLLGLDAAIPDETKNFLTDMTTLDGGKIEVSDELKDLASSNGIEIANADDLKKLSQADTEKLIKAREKSLEEQAKANQSFEDSITAFKQSVSSFFIMLQPLIDGLTSVVQFLTKSPVMTGFIAAVIGLTAILPKLISGFGFFKESAFSMSDTFKKIKEKGVGSSIKDMFSRNVKDSAKNMEGVNEKSSSGIGGFVKGLVSMSKEALNIDLKGITRLSVSLGILIAPIGILGFLFSSVPPSSLLAFGGVMIELSIALAIMSKFLGNIDITNVSKGALSMIIMGAALIPFAYALTQIGSIDWGVIGMMVVGIIALAGITALLASFAPLMLAGAGVLAAASVGLLIFGAAIMVFATASQMMQGMKFDWLGSLGENLLDAAPGLLLGGLALLTAAPALMIGALAMIPMMGVLEKASSIDWNSFGAMSSALYTISGAILAFGAATMAGGIMSTIGGLLGGGGPLSMLETLATLAIEAAAPLMMMSEAINSLSDGLEKLSAASASLDMEKLDMLRELAWSMAIGAVGGGIMGDSIDKIAEALMKLTKSGEGGGGGGGTKKIEINLKLNGRDIQRVIVDDTSIVS